MNPTIMQTLARTAAADKATIADLIELESHGINVVKELGTFKASVMRRADRGDIDHRTFMEAVNRALN